MIRRVILAKQGVSDSGGDDPTVSGVENQGQEAGLSQLREPPAVPSRPQSVSLLLSQPEAGRLRRLGEISAWGEYHLQFFLVLRRAIPGSSLRR